VTLVAMEPDASPVPVLIRETQLQCIHALKDGREVPVMSTRIRPSVMVRSILILLVGLMAACSDNNNDKDDYAWWENERAVRLAALDSYLEENSEGFTSFRTAPLSIKRDDGNFVGFQMLIFRLLPELFPQYWGPEEEQMSRLALGPDPFDNDSFLPLGIGFSLPTGGELDPKANYATLSCMGCHAGGFIDGNGDLIRMIGAPSPTPAVGGAVEKTVKDPAFTVANIKAAVAAKPLGWFYGFLPEYLDQEIKEREFYEDDALVEFFMKEISIPSNELDKILADTLELYTYNIPNPGLRSGMPGSLDVFSDGAAQSAYAAKLDTTTTPTMEEALPALPGPADIPAAWALTENRPKFQWDNSLSNPYYREVAASLAVSGGDPHAVNMDNVVAAAEFAGALPTQPYPFDVSERASSRGQEIFQQACLSCHLPDNTTTISPDEVGTDSNRANVFTAFSEDSLRTLLRKACTGKPECLDSDGLPYPDDEILFSTGGYAPIPLDGIWATAPYLHNGSVPTLYHLLSGDRPNSFYRGNYAYDPENVGFVWDRPVDVDRAVLYDTSKSGYANTGHTGLTYTGGIDWDEDPDALWDLLEYLKTL
jgi:mono/diheme cytochrome c family protein